MAVYDRWHLSHPQPGDKPCEHRDRIRGQLYPSADHGKGKRWQVRWHDAEGKQPKRNFDKKTGNNPEIHADAFDAKIQAELNAGTYIDPAAGKVLLRTYAKEWLSAQTSDPSSLEILDRWYRLRIENSVIGDRELVLLARRPSMVQQWIKEMEAGGLGPTSIGWALTMLSTVFGAAVADGIVARNPCRSSSVRPPRRAERPIVPATFEELEALREGLPERYRAMVELGFGAGMRRGEILACGKGDVAFLRREVKVVRQVKKVGGRLIFAPPKGGKTRTVPIDDEALLRLSAHIEEFPPVEVQLPWGRPDGPLVAVPVLFGYEGRRRKGVVPTDILSDMWVAAREAAGIQVTDEDEAGIHWLRHTAASAWLAGGADILKVAAWLGHSDPAFTLKTYTHLVPDKEDLARTAMAAFRKPAEETKINPSSALDVP